MPPHGSRLASRSALTIFLHYLITNGTIIDQDRFGIA